MLESLKIEDEIERKWILKNSPFNLFLNYYPDKTLIINQWYVNIDGKNYRIRKTDNEDVTEWIMIHKESVSKGVNREHIYPISEQEALIYIKSATKEIEKLRHIKDFGEFKIEVDIFIHIHLIMMEIELPSLDYEFKLPKEIEDQIICEVTGNKAFDNFNLAYAIHNTSQI